MPTATKKATSLNYFGELAWTNLLDWFITFCLGGILALTTMQLGGVRPETQVMLQPLYILLMALHGLFVAATPKEDRRFNPVPFFFIPFLVWAFASVLFWTPTPWRGSYELTYFFSAFLVAWVAVNNIRTRAHLWVLLIIAMVPLGQAIFIGYYQFFQDPSRMASVSLGYPIELSAQYHGRATGLFADPGSFAAYLLIILPCFIIAAFVPRLPPILRIFSFYVALILVVGITLTQTYWAAAAVVIIMAVVPWFCFEKASRRGLFSLLGVIAAASVFVCMYFYNPLFWKGFARALTPEGEGFRLVLWQDALSHLLQNPIMGSGAGSYALTMENSASLSLAKAALTPHNDFLLILNSYGVIGASLLFLPMGYIIYRALRQWSKEPFRLKTRDSDRYAMPNQKFFLALSICAVVSVMLCAAFHFPVYIPALLLYSVLMFSLLAKLSFRRTVPLPAFSFSGTLYFLTCTVVSFTFWAHAALVTESQGLELQANQRLENLVEEGVSVSGNFKLVDQVVDLYQDALITDLGNADAWIGLSMTVCQLHYRNPAAFKRTGERAVTLARRAYEICPEYWLASAQLGVAYALSGEIDAARAAFKRALEIAPNSSNAHYYYAAFLSGDTSMQEEAIKQVRRALDIDPENAAARRLEQKLLIL